LLAEPLAVRQRSKYVSKRLTVEINAQAVKCEIVELAAHGFYAFLPDQQARMSTATCGIDRREIGPGCRFAHPGYACCGGWGRAKFSNSVTFVPDQKSTKAAN
jgi:hypothetical protein